jgi:hypothetical protein
MKTNENEEISLIKLIVIPIKRWKLGVITFLLLYILGVIVFIAHKKIQEAKNKDTKSTITEVITNEVSNGYLWISYNTKDYHIYSNDEILDMLFIEGDLSNKFFLRWPNLKCQRSNGMISFLSGNQEMLRVRINFTPDRTIFSTEKVVTSDKSEVRLTDHEDINKINQIVVDTFLKEANVRINNYKKIRKSINRVMSPAWPEMNNIGYASGYHTAYMNLEKEYLQTAFNVYSASVPIEQGMSLKKFAILYFMASFFISLMIVFFREFSKDNLISEIKKAMNENK